MRLLRIYALLLVLNLNNTIALTTLTGHALTFQVAAMFPINDSYLILAAAFTAALRTLDFH